MSAPSAASRMAERLTAVARGTTNKITPPALPPTARAPLSTNCAGPVSH
ncbi:hypothetical protein [Streptomyces sp. NPDC051310]